MQLYKGKHLNASALASSSNNTASSCLSFLMSSDLILPRVLNCHFTTITGHDACVITPEATLPSNIFLNPDLPLVPVIIKSTFLFLAYSTIADTIDVAVTTTSV